MHVATQTHCLSASNGDSEAIRILADAGFDSIDYSFFDMCNPGSPWLCEDWRSYAASLRDEAAQRGISFSQAHAPFGRDVERCIDVVLKSMEAASILGASHIVVHPIQDLLYVKNKKLLFERNIDYYRSLIPFCEKWNITVCAENMWQMDDNRQVIISSICADPEEFRDLIDAVDSPWIRGCLDIGHCALTSVDPVDALHILGSDRVVALHVHDVDYLRDCHTLPFVQKLDWESICRALAETGYRGDFTFEADYFLFAMPNALRPAASRFMEQTGRYLAGRVEAYHQKA